MPRDANRPPGLKQLNNSLWQFYSPDRETEIEMEIIFLHGLQLVDFKDAFWKTWLVRGCSEPTVWPKEWLAKMFTKARILSVTYNSCVTKTDGQLTMQSLGNNLVSDIILDSTYNIGQNCPVFLVGHSWGGIVMKQLVLSAIRRMSIIQNNSRNLGDFEKINNFYNNLCGVLYYATPHNGSRLADWATRVPRWPSLYVELLTTLSDETAIINSDFSLARSIPAFAVVEGLETSYGAFQGKVVEEGSSRYDIDLYYTIADADHFTVCKAKHPRDAVIMKLVGFIKASLDQKEVRYSYEKNSL